MRNNCASFMTRLSRDTRANTMALVAAAIVPLAGLIGGGVDMSRLYLTKARLQQACDAGALAGRKAMGGGAWTTSGTNNSNAAALAMFDGNFGSGDYGTGSRSRSYTESNGEVSGIASVDVPMSVMRVFGFASQTISVNCAAKMAIPNTDVMFVLDVTGSMASTNAGDTVSKINGLKKAVKCFYEALLKVDTTADCGTTPTATSYTGTAQIRMGFMPYSVNVNVGKLLPNAYLDDSWQYQSRHAVLYSVGAPSTSSSTETGTFYSSGSCSSWASGSDTSGFPATSSTPSSFVGTTNSYGWVSYNSYTRVCTRSVNSSSATYTRDDNSGTYFHTWIYRQETHNVSGLKAGGSSWNNSISLRLGSGGTMTSVGWDGCIEERQTVKNSDHTPADEWSPLPANAYDLDIDMVPNGSTGTEWGPILSGAVWGRYDGYGNATTADVITNSNLSRNSSYYCPAEAKKLQSWTTAAPFESYVNSLSPTGNTYHDIGMIWGARFISPTGMFATENTNLPRIQRHIIFMTDGDTNVINNDYSAYGIHWWDRRQTTYAPSNSDLNNILNARLESLCAEIKSRNITLWVISYGSDVSSTSETRLNNCASPGKYFRATNSSALISNFQQIASQIAELRLTS